MSDEEERAAERYFRNLFIVFVLFGVFIITGMAVMRVLGKG